MQLTMHTLTDAADNQIELDSLIFDFARSGRKLELATLNDTDRIYIRCVAENLLKAIGGWNA